jgi:NAD-dependent deacetylase
LIIDRKGGFEVTGLDTLKRWIRRSDNIVFFGGAGVSTESGIPDFRSVDGLYNVKYDYPPETIISHSFFMKRPADFYKFYWDKMIYPKAQANVTHKALAKLEEEGKVQAVITQNIDGLHQAAGSRNVLELHGSVHRNKCVNCGKSYSLNDLLREKEGEEWIPHCECGGVVKPDVVLYEEGLDDTVIKRAVQYISNAEVLIIGGTSLSVYPAAGLIRYYGGEKLVLINRTPTPYDKNVDLLLPYSLGEVFSQI